MIPASALNELHSGVRSSKYITATCCSPIYRRVRLAEDGSYHDMYCNCGQCMTCQDRRRNEMAARMFLHATKYDHCVFVTLTYGSYNLLHCKRHPFLADWLQTVPTIDSHNTSGYPRWTPTIIVKAHLQKFFKRLNKAVGSFTYCACGEYGHDFGRPHYHAIIFSNQLITEQQIQDAWSLECKRTSDKYIVRPWRGDMPKNKTNGYFKFRIGEIKYYDLYANGSMNYDGKHPGEFQSGYKAMNNFTYVAKYIGKSRDALCNLPNWVYSRIRYAYDVYTNDINHLALNTPNPYPEQLQIKNLIISNYDNESFKQIYFDDFKKIVSPFFLSSRRPAIGKQYFLENAKRFQAKEFSLPKFMGESLEFPGYYFRLLAQYEFPIRLRKIVPSGVSLTKDFLPRVYSYFSNLREDGNFWYTVRCLPQPKKENELDLTYIRNGIYLYSITGRDIEGEVDHIDFVDPRGSVIHFVYNPLDELFRGYIYNPSTRSYDLYEHYYDREEFCDMVLSEIETEFDNLPIKQQKIDLQFDLQNAVLSDCEAIEERKRYLKLRQELNTKHKSENFNAL